MKYYFPLICTLVIFFILKVTGTSIRLSDTNIYFYTAYQLLQGKLLYRDIFFTNLPFFPYFSALYIFITGGNPLLYIVTATIEVVVTAWLIFQIAVLKTKEYRYAILSTLVYLFSFIILSTSDHQTGVFLASLFSVMAFLLWGKKRIFLSGIVMGIMLCTKAYFIPISIAFIIAGVANKQIKQTIRLIVGMGISIGLILLPFLLFTRNQLLTDIVQYSLTRSAGISKIDVAWFFFTKDILLALLLISSIIFIKRFFLFGVISLTGIIFFLFYKDTYYLYLNFLVPFLCIFLAEFLVFLHKKIHIHRLLIPTVICIAILFNVYIYMTYFRDLQKIQDLPSLIASIKKEKPLALYGTNDISPYLSYQTKVPLLNNIIDTNANIFRKKFLNATALTDHAMQTKTILVTHGVEYPEMNVYQESIDEIFDQKIVTKKCKKIASSPIYAEGAANRLNLLKCY